MSNGFLNKEEMRIIMSSLNNFDVESQRKMNTFLEGTSKPEINFLTGEIVVELGDDYFDKQTKWGMEICSVVKDYNFLHVFDNKSIYKENNKREIFLAA